MRYDALILMLIVFCHLSCKQQIPGDNIEAEEVSPSSSGPSQEEIDQLLESAIKDGNGRAYNRVAAHSLINQNHEAFFYYAFVMAAKHKNAEAYFHLYSIVAGRGSGRIKSIDELDPAIRDFALYCLLRSYELDNEIAKSRVEDLFQKNIPTSKSYCQGICEELK